MVHFILTKSMQKLISIKNRFFLSLFGPSVAAIDVELFRNWNASTKFWQSPFYQHSPPVYENM